MKLVTIKTATATDRQLLDFARTFLQIDGVQPNSSRETLLSKIAKVHQHDTVTVVSTDDEAPEPEHNAPPARVVPDVLDDGLRMDTDSRSDPTYTIILQQQSGLGNFGKRPVPVGVNGRVMLIPRGIEVTIPARFFLALREAVESKFEDVVDQDNPTKVERVETETLSYPFQIVKQPTQAELDTWAKAKADKMSKRSTKQAA